MTWAQATAIGLIVAEWAMVEDLMGLAMGALLCRGADYMERQIVAAQMDYRHRRDALAAYAGILPDGPAKAELQYILIEIERTRENPRHRRARNLGQGPQTRHD